MSQRWEHPRGHNGIVRVVVDGVADRWSQIKSPWLPPEKHFRTTYPLVATLFGCPMTQAWLVANRRTGGETERVAGTTHTHEALDEACRQVALNVASYVQDAAALIDLGRWRGVFVLSTLALEEIGKAWSLQQPGEPTERVRLYESVRRNHTAKLTKARQFGSLVEQFAYGVDETGRRVIDIDAVFDEGHGYQAEVDHDTRMSGAYVDILEGLPVGGRDVITEEAARTQFDHAHVIAHALARFLTAQTEHRAAG